MCASKPGGDEHELGLERAHRGLDDVVERALVLLVAAAGPERDVERRLGLVVRAARSRDRTATRAARRRRPSRVVAEDLLGAVPVVDVPVDDRDALDAELGLRVAGGDRDVVEDAEAHRRVPAAHGGPGGRTSAKPPRSTAAIAEPGGEERRLERRPGRDRVAVEPGRLAQRPDLRDVLAARGSARPARPWPAPPRRTRRPSRAAPRGAAACPDGGRSGAAERGRGASEPPRPAL